MRTINIISDNGFYAERDAYLLTDGTLELSVNLPQDSGEYFFVYKNRGKGPIKIKLEREESVVIKGLESGELTATIKHYLRGELLEIYPVEGLVLKDVDGKVYGVPIIEHFKAELDGAEKRIKALESTASAFTEIIKKLNFRIKNLEKINEGD